MSILVTKSIFYTKASHTCWDNLWSFFFFLQFVKFYSDFKRRLHNGNGRHSTLCLMLSPRGSYLPPWMLNTELKQSYLTKTLSLTIFSQAPWSLLLVQASIGPPVLTVPTYPSFSTNSAKSVQIDSRLDIWPSFSPPTSDADVLDLPPPRTLQAFVFSWWFFHPLTGPTTQWVLSCINPHLFLLHSELNLNLLPHSNTLDIYSKSWVKSSLPL